MERSLEEKLKEAWSKAYGSHTAPCIAFIGFWFRLTECPLLFIALSGHIKCWFYCLRKRNHDWLEHSLEWVTELSQVYRDPGVHSKSPQPCSALHFMKLSWAVTVPVLVHKQGPAAQSELLITLCSCWGTMGRRQHNTFLKAISAGDRQCLFFWWPLQLLMHFTANM